jgi:hypothetical protein
VAKDWPIFDLDSEIKAGVPESLPPQYVLLTDKVIETLLELKIPNLGATYPLVFSTNNIILADRPNMGPPYVICRDGVEYYRMFHGWYSLHRGEGRLLYGDARNTLAGALPLTKEEQKKMPKLDKEFLPRIASEIRDFRITELRDLRVSWNHDHPPSSTNPGSAEDKMERLSELLKAGNAPTYPS